MAHASSQLDAPPIMSSISQEAHTHIIRDSILPNFNLVASSRYHFGSIYLLGLLFNVLIKTQSRDITSF